MEEGGRRLGQRDVTVERSFGLSEGFKLPLLALNMKEGNHVQRNAVTSKSYKKQQENRDLSSSSARTRILSAFPREWTRNGFYPGNCRRNEPADNLDFSLINARLLN